MTAASLRTLLCLCLLAWGLGPAPALAKKRTVFEPARAPFSASCRGLTFNYRLQSVFVIPGETLQLSVLDADYKREYDFFSNTGQARSLGPREWAWTAPLLPGIYSATLRQAGSDETIQLQPVVMIPAGDMAQGCLRGYPIGEYPPPTGDETEPHLPPKGFVEITAENQGTSLTPHFLLGSFACPDPPVFPRYAVIDERLLIKLETLLEALNTQGYPCRTLLISSAYRTPAYNQKRRHARYSSHQWGQAADILVDGNRDGAMDDVNRDGRIDSRDAQVIGAIVNSLDGTMRYQDVVGGLGLYDEGRGAFVHVDVRGSIARWEQIMRKRETRTAMRGPRPMPPQP